MDELKENEKMIEPINMNESKRNDENSVQHENLNQHNFCSLNLDNPENWKDIHINQKMRDFLVEMGIKRVDDILFLKNSQGRYSKIITI